jgi:hypothetical protein
LRRPDELKGRLATRTATASATFWQHGYCNSAQRKGKWAKARQANIDRLMFAHFETAAITGPVTNLSHGKTEHVNY